MEKKSKMRILVLDDDKEMRASLDDLLEAAGFDALTIAIATDAERHIAEFMPDAILSDVRMPGRTGLDLLATLNDKLSPPLVLMSAHGDIPMAVEAMQNGAYSFLEKPFDPRRLISILQHAANQHQLSQTTQRLKERLSDLSGLNRIFLGQSEVIAQLREQVIDYAQLQASVLLVGETGTGKDIIARALHDLSGRASAPFRAINCAAIPATQFEEMMFGQEGQTVGLLKHVHGGTLYLDEVSSAALDIQAKFLRVLEDRSFTPIGSSKEIECDFRLITTAKSDPLEEMKAGNLREDFFYRIQQLEIHLPPLRDHRDDIPILLAQFLQDAAQIYEVTAPEISSDDLAILMGHPWPGNVRELRNLAERLVLSSRVGKSSIASILKSDADLDDVPENLRGAVAAFERSLIARAIKAHQGRMDETAAALGIGRRTLNEKIVKLGLEKDKIL